MNALVEFLRTRLDKDEQVAHAAHYEGQRWITEEEEVYRWPDDEPVYSADRKRDAAHIARHAPARVLRDVTARRALLDSCAQLIADGEVDCNDGGPGLADDVVRALASVYADHPDYRAEWAPDTATAERRAT